MAAGSHRQQTNVFVWQLCGSVDAGSRRTGARSGATCNQLGNRLPEMRAQRAVQALGLTRPRPGMNSESSWLAQAGHSLCLARYWMEQGAHIVMWPHGTPICRQPGGGTRGVSAAEGGKACGVSGGAPVTASGRQGTRCTAAEGERPSSTTRRLNNQLQPTHGSRLVI